MTNELDRRAFLRRSALGAAGVVVLGSPLLAACSSDSKSNTGTSAGSSSSGGGGASFGAYNIQLSWIKNVEFAGMYIADTKGYYTQQGFSSVNLITGGPNVKQDANVASQSGGAFIGTSDPIITAAAINNGAKLIVVGAQYQKSPFCIMSRAKDGMPTPADMKGRRIGVQDTNLPIWNAFLAVNNLKQSDVTTVSVLFDPSELVADNPTVDGWFSFVTNEPIDLKKKGHDTVNFLLSDNGLPLASQHYIVNTDALKENRDKVKAALVGEILGWRDSIKDPTQGAHLAATKYGTDLNLDEAEQVDESKAQNDLILNADTKANGIFTITDDLVSKTVDSLSKAGQVITKEKLYDLSLIKEVYAEHADLKASPG